MASHESYPVVNTTAGPVTGFIDTHKLSEHSTARAEAAGDRTPIRKWLGIPYAQAGRWQRPTDPDPWEGPLECFEFGPIFPQMGNPFDALYEGKEGWYSRLFLGQSEDAFTVNVFAPAGDLRNLPVLVWFYGGNFNSGGSNFPVYDPTEFVRQQWQIARPCVVVTGNYRVGIFGFLSTDDLAEVNGHPGNFGLHDCIKMLEWTRENIARFGGNPNNVTAMGESAGAYAVATLFHSGRKLFQKAILESGSHGVMFYRPKPTFPPYSQLLDLLGVDERTDAQSRVRDLKKIPMTKLRDTTAQVFYPDMWGITYDPSEQGWKSSVWSQLEKGEYDPWIESAIISINTDEGTFFSNRGKWWEESRLLNVLKARGLYSEETYPEFQRLYPNTQPDANNPLTEVGSSKFFHDQPFLTPLHHFAHSLTATPNAVSNQRLKVFVCQFNCIPSRLFNSLEQFGALHTGEVPFVMNTSSLWSYDNSSDDAKTALIVGRFWSSFAQTGNPGADWPAYTVSKGEGIEISQGGTHSLMNVNELRQEYREFWYSIMEQLYR